MDESEFLQQSLGENETEMFDFDELEKKLEEQLSEHLQDLEALEEESKKIEEPEELGNAVLSVVWEQFVNQVGVVAGEEFIAENRGLKLDLRNEAHIQTTENFSEGKIATHNDKIDYQQRYDEWQNKFEKDDSGKVLTHPTRTGKEVERVKKEARLPFDKDRPKGSANKHTDMDHTVPAAEIIRDPEANAHLSLEKQVEFANSKENLNELDSGMNKSKSDLPMEEWLDTPNKNGQKPNEIFDIDESTEQKLREKDKEARAAYEKKKAEGVDESIRTGKQSQREEAFRIGGKALRSMIMSLLADLIRSIVGKLIVWLQSQARNFQTFIEHVKKAIISFAVNVQRHILTAGNALVNTIATSIIGPVVNTIRKVWTAIKQGAKSVKEAIDYLKEPKNKGKSISIMMLEIGKIIIAGITAAGAIFLGEAIEKVLMSIPGFAIQIPIIGSLASIVSIFLGAVICGIAGALILNLINSLIVKKKREELLAQQILEGSEVLNLQAQKVLVDRRKLEIKKIATEESITNRHIYAANYIRISSEKVFDEHQDRSFDTDVSKIDVILHELNEDN